MARSPSSRPICGDNLPRSEEHTSELQSHRDLHSFPTRRSSDLTAPVTSDLGYMPAFRDSFTDGQVAELASYLRRQFAPDKPAWSDIHATIGRIRQEMAR